MEYWVGHISTVVGAVVVAIAVGYLAHNEMGMSPGSIRTGALEAAAVVGVALASKSLLKKNDE